MQKRHPRRHLPDRHRRKNCSAAVQFRNCESARRIVFARRCERRLEKFLRQTTGLLLLTGPAGSGKTTTIYACLRHLAELGGRHIITVEDPVEQIVPGTMQTEINEAIGDEINALAPDYLWVALGVPYEQAFVEEFTPRLSNVGVIKTSGGLFNFLSGSRARAPRWMQNAGSNGPGEFGWSRAGCSGAI